MQVVLAALHRARFVLDDDGDLVEGPVERRWDLAEDALDDLLEQVVARMRGAGAGRAGLESGGRSGSRGGAWAWSAYPTAVTARDDAPASSLVALRIDEAAAPSPDPSATAAGYLVTVDSAVRLHFLDWGGPTDRADRRAAGPEAPTVVLIHGIAQTSATWAPVARRLRAARHTIALDLRGHGLSDSPTHGYDPDTLAGDVEAVVDASAGEGEPPTRVVLVGHGFGAMVAAWAAARLGDRCVGLVLVDGGWEDVAASNGLEPDEFLKAVEEPPEILRSMGAYLADRRAFDPSTWDADQEAAARAAVVEVPAGQGRDRCPAARARRVGRGDVRLPAGARSRARSIAPDRRARRGRPGGRPDRGAPGRRAGRPRPPVGRRSRSSTCGWPATTSCAIGPPP